MNRRPQWITLLGRRLRTPVATLLLGAAFVADYISLPRQSFAKAVILDFGVVRCFIPPSVPIDRVGGTLVVGASSSGPNLAAHVSLWQRDRRDGFWAPTWRTRWLNFHMYESGNTPLTASERQQAESLAIGRFQSSGYINASDAAILAAGGIDTREVIWAGYAHDAAALTVAVLLVRSLSWVPRASRRAREEAALREGICFACGYDLKGVPGGPCPECGRPPAKSPS